MEEILKIVIENLVDNKDSITINKSEENDVVRFEITVANEEMGKLIGRKGKIAHAIRTLMKSVASKENKKVTIEFVETEK